MVALPRLLGRQRLKRSFVKIIRQLLHREQEHKERKKRIKHMQALDIHKHLERKRLDIRRRVIRLPFVRHEKRPLGSDIRREHELMYGLGYHTAVAVVYPARLINHLYCKTARPIYVHAVRALAYPADKIMGVYMAVQNIVDRLRRPMARSRNTADKDWQADPKSLRNILTLLKKSTGKAFTRIVKLIDKVVDRTTELPVLRHISGFAYKLSLVEAAVRQSLAERWYAFLQGYRERAFLYRSVKHCSFYAYIAGIPFDGLPSGWYYWRRRYRICRNTCSRYTDYVKKSVCFNLCEAIVAVSEPNTIQLALSYFTSTIENVISRL